MGGLGCAECSAATEKSPLTCPKCSKTLEGTPKERSRPALRLDDRGVATRNG